MPWIFFLLALGCFAIALRTQSIGLALVCLLAALGLMLAGALGLVSARIQSRTEGGGMSLNPAIERQRLLKQREAGGGGETGAAVGTGAAAGKGRSGAKDAADKEGLDAGGSGADGGGGGD